MADGKGTTHFEVDSSRESLELVEENLNATESFGVTKTSGLGEHCKTDRPTPSGYKPSGEICQLGGVSVYISKPPSDSSTRPKFLLFLSGATGLHSVNNQIQADKFAQEGFLVVLPDMFSDDPLTGTATYKETNDSIVDRVKQRVAETAKSFMIDMWLARQTPQKVLPIIMKVMEASREEFADVIASGGGIYSVGYCFGGRMTLLLASEKFESLPITPWRQKVDDEESNRVESGPFIRAGAICHATLVTKEDFQGIKSPVSFVCVENDQLFPDDIRDFGEESLKCNNVENEFKTYTGVPHGFAVFGEYEDEKIKVAQAEAFEQTLAWLQLH